MEKAENQDKFLLELPRIVELISLKKDFLKSLEKDQYFRNYYQTLRKWSTNREKTLFILMAMKKERETVRNLIKYLSESGQTEAVQLLAPLNESKGPVELSLDIKLVVNPVKAPKKDLSSCYNLLKYPRGKCIIINNVEEPQNPNILDDMGNVKYRSKGLKNETKRFVHIFKELYFDVQVLKKLTALQIDRQLNQISDDQSLEKDEALVVIVISHGGNEQVLGYNACEANRKIRFGEVSGPDIREAYEEMKADVIGIKQIISIFAEQKCVYLRSKPKLYFFICCRIKSHQDTEPKAMSRKDVNNNELVRETMGATSIDTFVSYACAEGYETFFDSDWGMSYFGQALTHSIAQYACDEPLAQILGRTSTRLKKMYLEGDQSSVPLGSFAIEVNTYAMDRQLFFNPGIVSE